MQESRLEFAKRQLAHLENCKQEELNIMAGEVSYDYFKDGDCWTGEFIIDKDDVKELLNKKIVYYTNIINKLTSKN